MWAPSSLLPPFAESTTSSSSPPSESSSLADGQATAMGALVEHVNLLLSRLTQADALTLTNRLKQQHLQGADTLSRAFRAFFILILRFIVDVGGGSVPNDSRHSANPAALDDPVVLPPASCVESVQRVFLIGVKRENEELRRALAESITRELDVRAEMDAIVRELEVKGARARIGCERAQCAADAAILQREMLEDKLHRLQFRYTKMRKARGAMV
ncbi:hypothetical protein B0H21DRAFT_827208 [Amylocystis lapponica]|nr:hypothetical protein B0H21DRAFT_827208 [Amylocystis lapponica]